ncbi:MAG: DUF2793 domain-containing protein [Proteobacteria bacterium]|nr:DUF2793 domain-containing protein [Pseudomonadota bacterium]
MTDTANLGLPCIEGSQAQKHVTHNEALRILDTLVQLAVKERDLTAPPVSPAEGQRWIVKTGATGAWAGHVNDIAAWQDSAWQFSAPQTGWLCYVIDEGALLAWTGSAWVDAIAALTCLNNMTLLGVGTTADATNPLSAKLNNALLAARATSEGGDGNLRWKLSKESAAKTLSVLLQDNYSGRAEIGLTGDDDLHIRVSADGATWRDGLVISASTGAVSLPNTAIGRTMLTANRTFYVRTDGNDANDGSANSAGAAFRTIQKAIDVTAALDLSVYSVTISVADGTFTENLVLKPLVGAGGVTIQGNPTTPANCVIAPASGQTVTCDGVRGYALNGIKATSAGGVCFYVLNRGGLTLRNVNFGGSPGGSAIYCNNNAAVVIDGNVSVSGGYAYWLNCQNASVMQMQGVTMTLSGTPAFTNFVMVGACAVALLAGVTYSGSATGSRYSVSANGVVQSGGGTLPGSTAGTTASGGQYL